MLVRVGSLITRQAITAPPAPPVVEGDLYWDQVCYLVHFEEVSDDPLAPGDGVSFKDEKGGWWERLGPPTPALTTDWAMFGNSSLNYSDGPGQSSRPMPAGTYDALTLELAYKPYLGGGYILAPLSRALSYASQDFGILALVPGADAEYVDLTYYITGEYGEYVEVVVRVDTEPHRVAMVLSDNTLYCFVDGVLRDTAAVPFDWEITEYNGGWECKSGPVAYIDELRVTLGVGRYTQDYALATEPFPNYYDSPPEEPSEDPYADLVWSLTNFEAYADEAAGMVADEKGRAIILREDSALSSDAGLFGSGARLNFHGTHPRPMEFLDIINASDTNVCTIEFAFRYPVLESDNIGLLSIGGGRIMIRKATDGEGVHRLMVGWQGPPVYIEPPIVAGTYYRLALSKSEDHFYIFLNGTLVHDQELVLEPFEATEVIYFGEGGLGSWMTPGCDIDELRITLGVARYTEDYPVDMGDANDPGTDPGDDDDEPPVLTGDLFILSRNANEARVIDTEGNQVSTRVTEWFTGGPISYSPALDVVAYTEAYSGNEYLRYVYSDNSYHDFTGISATGVNSIVFSQDGKYVALNKSSGLQVFLAEDGTPVSIGSTPIASGAPAHLSVAFIGDMLFYGDNGTVKRVNLLTGVEDTFYEPSVGACSIAYSPLPGAPCAFGCLEYANPEMTLTDYVVYSLDGTTMSEVFRIEGVSVPIAEMAMAFDGANALVVGSFHGSNAMHSWWQGQLYTRAYSPMMMPYYAWPAPGGWLYNDQGEFAIYSGDLDSVDRFDITNLNGTIYPYSTAPGDPG